LDLEAGGDGGKLVVGRLRISYQIVPAGECLPAEVETVFIPSPSFIGIACHSVNQIHSSLMLELDI
jgi:hypothetical protein